MAVNQEMLELAEELYRKIVSMAVTLPESGDCTDNANLRNSRAGSPTRQPPAPQDSEIYRSAEVCEMLDVSRSALRRLAERSKIPENDRPLLPETAGRHAGARGWYGSQVSILLAWKERRFQKR